MKRNAILTCLALALTALALMNPKIVAFRAEASAPPEQVVTVPLFRLVNGGRQNLYTIDPNEMAALQKLTDEWDYKGISCYVLPKKIPGAVEMYRLRKSGGYGGRTILKLDNKSWDYFFYTANKTEAENAANNLGWTLEGVAFYVFPKAITDTVPLNRYYTPATQKTMGDPLFPYTMENPEVFYYTTDNPSSSSSHFEHVEAYVWQQAVTLDAANGLVAPKANNNVIKAPAGGGPGPSAQQQLFTLGCAQNAGKKTITCPTIQGVELCNYYKKKGELNVTYCTTTADQFKYDVIEKDLTAQGCSNFLGRAGEYLCQTLKGAQACRDYMKKGDGLVTRCLSVKDAEMNQDLKKHGCYDFLGREGDYMCPTADGFKTCENYRIDGRLKVCRQPTKK